MAIFPVIKSEKSIQVEDRIRFRGGRSYVSRGSDAITTMTIKPGADGSAIDVFNADTDLRFLDWQFTTFEIDIDATNNKLNFNEGGSELTATLTNATYSLAALATQIAAQLNTVGSNTYTVSVNAVDKVTISVGTGESFSLLPQTGSDAAASILPIIGFKPKAGFGDADFASKSTLTGDRVRSMPRAVTIEVGDGSTTESRTLYVDLFSVDGDALFSSDADLQAHRHDILDWLPEDRDSFLHIHRRAQGLILEFLDRAGYVDINGDPLDIDAFVMPEEAKYWSIFLALRIIHDELSNDPDDDFFAKARDFEHLEERHRDRAIFRLDSDNDGKADVGEGVQITGGVVVRR